MGDRKRRNLRPMPESQRAAISATLRQHGARVGRKATPEHRSWCHMIQRCTNPNNDQFHDYGGRSITVCARWRESFASFLADMGTKPTPKHTIDRKDNDKGYWCGHADCPECGSIGRVPNCRWATRPEQARNTRSNRMITFAGRTMCLTDWLKETGLPHATLSNRLNRGWSVERALTEPAHAYLNRDRSEAF